MPRQRAKIARLAGCLGTESNGRAGSLVDNMLRAGALIGENNVMFGAIAVYQGQLHDIAFASKQLGIDDLINGAAEADVDHAALGNTGAQCEPNIGNVARRNRRIGNGRYRCCSGHRCDWRTDCASA